MSELIQNDDSRATIRWKLLTGVSALALTLYISSAAKADDADRPQIWIEVGGQMDMLQGTSHAFSAPFFAFPTAAFDDAVTNDSLVSGGPSIYGKKSFGQKQAPPRIVVGGEGKIIFQPENSDWVFSAAISYGRAHDKKHTHYQGPQLFTRYSTANSFDNKYAAPFSDTLTRSSERHMAVDFQVGKDVGLGLFGHEGTSTISAGVRFAQFSAKSSTHISARPYAALYYYSLYPKFHQYFLTGHQARSFKGVGPSLSWNASAALAGNKERGELTLDWGVEGALLFGRQKAKTDHGTSAYQLTNPSIFRHAHPALYPARNDNAPLRSRNVIVPDVSGFIGLSAKLPHSKISIGYKGDIWFGAVDRGIDARKTSNLTFNGPYASISFGLGD